VVSSALLPTPWEANGSSSHPFPDGIAEQKTSSRQYEEAFSVAVRQIVAVQAIILITT
jgi:hypothetical protein